MMTIATDDVRTVVVDALRRKLSESARSNIAITGQTKLLELDIMNSQGLLDVILEVEERCGRQFDPEAIDLEGGITLDALARAFAVQP